MALPLMLGICLVAGVACFLTDRATKAANKFTHDGDNVNSRPPAPATSSNNLKRRSPATSSNNLNRGAPAAPATSSNNLNRRTPEDPAISSDNLNRRPPAPATSYNPNRWPPAPATSSNNDLNRRSPATPATSSDNLNRLLPAPATLSDNLNPRPLAPATSSNNPVMHVGDIAGELAKYEVCPLVHSTDAVGPVEVHLQTNMVEEVEVHLQTNMVEEVEVHLQTNMVEEVKISELSNGLENNNVFKGNLGDGLGAVTSVVDLELDDNIDLITPLVEEADVLKLEEETLNLCGGVIGSGEGWWVEERFRWVKGKLKCWAEWPMLDPDVDMRRTLRRLVWVVVDSMVESKYGIGHYRVLLKMYRILINELRCR